MEDFGYPKVLDPKLVGTYPASAKAGGGYVWDAVLEYRVWCHPERGAPDLDDGSDYFCPFESYQEAFEFSQQTEGAEEPMALILQEEYISEPEPGHFIHVRERRITEWQVVWLKRPRRTPQTIPAFLSPDAPTNRLDVLRGITATDA
jgi:putative acetyltransferase